MYSYVLLLSINIPCVLAQKTICLKLKEPQINLQAKNNDFFASPPFRNRVYNLKSRMPAVVITGRTLQVCFGPVSATSESVKDVRSAVMCRRVKCNSIYARSRVQIIQCALKGFGVPHVAQLPLNQDHHQFSPPVRASSTYPMLLYTDE